MVTSLLVAATRSLASFSKIGSCRTYCGGTKLANLSSVCASAGCGSQVAASSRLARAAIVIRFMVASIPSGRGAVASYLVRDAESRLLQRVAHRVGSLDDLRCRASSNRHQPGASRPLGGNSRIHRNEPCGKRARRRIAGSAALSGRTARCREAQRRPQRCGRNPRMRPADFRTSAGVPAALAARNPRIHATDDSFSRRPGRSAPSVIGQRIHALQFSTKSIDSRFRGNDIAEAKAVIPVKAGIHWPQPNTDADLPGR